MCISIFIKILISLTITYPKCPLDFVLSYVVLFSGMTKITPQSIMLIQISVTSQGHNELTHWGRVTHICVSKQTIIGSDNGLSPGRRQAIIWTNAGILLIGTLGTNFSQILFEIRIFSFKKMGLKVSSAKWRPCCLGLNVLIMVWSTQVKLWQ